MLRRSRPSLAVVAAPANGYIHGEELHGWAIAKAANCSGPTVYEALDWFEDAELIMARWEGRNLRPGKPRRRLYKLNPPGFVQALQMLYEGRSS